MYMYVVISAGFALHIYIYIDARRHERVCVCVYARMYPCMYPCMYACMYVCMYVCLDVCVYIYIWGILG